jgi:hypothetical protein
MALLGEAMNRLSREYVAEGKTVTFEALKMFLDPVNPKKLPITISMTSTPEGSGEIFKQDRRGRVRVPRARRENVTRRVGKKRWERSAVC